MELHVCVIDSNRGLWHTVRRSGGGWTRFGDVRNAVLQAHPGSYDPKQFDVVECAGVAGELHVCSTTRGNSSDVRHTIRAANGTWPFPFGNVRAETGGQLPIQSLFQALGAGEAGGDLHVCASVKRKSEALESLTYQPYHTIRSSSAEGPWTAFTSILFGTGPVGPPDSTVQDIDCAGADGQLHVCCTILDDWTNNFAPRNVRHALRMVTGDWTSFGDVRTTVLGQNPGSMDPGTVFSYVSCAVVAGELHVCAQVAGEVWHTVRRSAGTWTPFTNVRAAILAAFTDSPNPGFFSKMSCSRVDENLHVCFMDGNGALWHTVREGKADGTWLFPFGDVVATVLRERPGSSDPRPIRWVATAGI